MNVKKPTDYSGLFAALDTLMAANLPQMELYCEIGRLVSGRPERARQWRLRSTCTAPILIFPASPPGTCGGCGIFTGPMPQLRRCWLRP